MFISVCPRLDRVWCFIRQTFGITAHFRVKRPLNAGCLHVLYTLSNLEIVTSYYYYFDTSFSWVWYLMDGCFTKLDLNYLKMFLFGPHDGAVVLLKIIWNIKSLWGPLPVSGIIIFLSLRYRNIVVFFDIRVAASVVASEEFLK